MQKFKLSINETVIAALGRKPSKEDVSKHLAYFENVELTALELADAINQGYSFSAVFKDCKRHSDNFQFGQWVAADFDKPTEDAREHPAVKAASILYNSPSYTPDLPKFRAIWLLESPVTDPTHYRKIKEALTWMLEPYGADKSVVDNARFFFGCKGSNPEFTGMVMTLSQAEALITEYQRYGAIEANIKTDTAKIELDNTPNKGKETYLSKVLTSLCDKVTRAEKGNRHNTLKGCARAAGGWVAGAGLDEYTARAALESAYRAHSPDEKEMFSLINWGIEKGKNDPIYMPESNPAEFYLKTYAPETIKNLGATDQNQTEEQIKPKFTQHENNDQGNARRLVERFGQNLRYVYQWGWLVWDGQRWEIDKTGAAMRLAKEAVKTILQEAANCPDENRQKELAKWYLQSGSKARIEGMLALAESEKEVVARPSDFDKPHMLLNCLNGTLDLASGKLRPHERNDLITKIIPVEYDPKATCPLWKGFLNTIMAEKQDLIAFLQRAIGYSLTGLTQEQVMFLMWGTGANGKSTFLETILSMLGDYARAANPTAFLAKDNSGDGPRNDIAALAGSRFVKAVESEKGRRWAESLIKEITGCDTISARFLHKEEFSFKPQLKLWFAANHKPKVQNQDNGIWRRLMLIPFTVCIPDDMQDKALTEKLKAELAGILAWSIKGLAEWRLVGLQPPEEVKLATQTYKQESDILAEFLGTCCIRGRADKHKTALGACYKAYVAWAQENDERAMSKANFGQALQERGYHIARGTGNQLTVLGLGLLAKDGLDTFMNGGK